MKHKDKARIDPYGDTNILNIKTVPVRRLYVLSNTYATSET